MKCRFITKHQKDLFDSFYLMLLQGVNQLLPIVVMPYLMVTLGAEGYGHIGFALSTIQYLILIVDFGFNLSATKQIAIFKNDLEKRSQIFWNVVAAKVLLLFLSTTIMVLLIVCLPTFRTYQAAIIATWPMVLGNTFTFMWFFQGIGKIRNLSIINTLSKVLLLPLIFVFVHTHDDYIMAAFLQAIVFVGTALLSNVYLYKLHVIKSVRPDMEKMLDETRTSFPLFLSSASTSLYTQLTIIILGFYCTTEEIGRYAAAERIMRAMCFLIYVPISQVFFQKISYAASVNKKDALQLFYKIRTMVVCIMLLIGLIIFTGGNWLPLLLGQDYTGIETLLRILSISPLAIGIGGVYGQLGLIAIGNKKASLRFRNVYFSASIVSLCLLFALTPVLKGVGASIVVSATEVIVAVLMVLNFKKSISLC